MGSSLTGYQALYKEDSQTHLRYRQYYGEYGHIEQGHRVLFGSSIMDPTKSSFRIDVL